MYFDNKFHRQTFCENASKFNVSDKVDMAVLYLLSADGGLWAKAKDHVKKGQIHLDDIKLHDGTPKSYTFLCCAKEFCKGTDYVTLTDLSNTDVINAKMFKVIVGALRIRREGIQLNELAKERSHVQAQY